MSGMDYDAREDFFVLGVDDLPDWFMNHVSSGDVTLYGERGYLAYITIFQGDGNPEVQRVRGDTIERQWLEVVLRRPRG